MGPADAQRKIVELEHEVEELSQVVETLTAERGFAIMRASNCSQHKENLTEVITAQWQQLAQREP